jgi:hypothetical protein
MKPSASSGRCIAFACAVASGGLSCSSLERFETSGDSAFCGDLVRAPRFQGGLLPVGVPPILSLRLKLEPENLTARPVEAETTESESPESYAIVGHLTSDDNERGLCAERPLFEESPLRTIPELDHDALKLFEFGEGRDYNFMSWVDSTCQGTMLAVVSLMRNDSVEMRLLKPAALAPPAAEPAKRPGFGLFYLHREAEGCEF